MKEVKHSDVREYLKDLDTVTVSQIKEHFKTDDVETLKIIAQLAGGKDIKKIGNCYYKVIKWKSDMLIVWVRQNEIHY